MIEIVYTIVDKRGKKPTTSVRCDAASNGDLLDFAQAWAQAIDPLIQGAIRACHAILGVDISGASGNVAGVGSDVEEIARFEFITDSGFKTEINIPAILETLIDNDTGEVIRSASAMAAFLDLVTEGVTANAELVEPVDAGGDDIVSVRISREGSRNSGSFGGF